MLSCGPAQETSWSYLDGSLACPQETDLEDHSKGAPEMVPDRHGTFQGALVPQEIATATDFQNCRMNFEMKSCGNNCKTT